VAGPEHVVTPKRAGTDHLGRPIWRATSVFSRGLSTFPSGADGNGEEPQKKEVFLADLRPTQPKLEAAKVNSMMQAVDDEPIHVIEGDNGPRIMDGHHRAAAAILRGDQTIEALCWYPNKQAVKKMLRPQRPQFMDVQLEFPISKRDEDKRLVFGWMYLPTDKDGKTIVDKHDDFMLPEDLEETAYKYVDTSRIGGVLHLRDSHLVKKDDNPVKVMSLVESMVFTPEKCEALGIAKNAVPDGAWWVGYRVNNDRVWDSVKDGTLSAFSVHGRAKRVPVSKAEGQPAGQAPATSEQQKPAPAEQPAPMGGEQQATPQVVMQQPQQRAGKTTRVKTRKVRPKRPENLANAMKVLANAKG